MTDWQKRAETAEAEAKRLQDEADAARAHAAKTALEVAIECLETGYTSGRIAERLRERGVAVTQSDLYPAALTFANACESARDRADTAERLAVALRDKAQAAIFGNATGHVEWDDDDMPDGWERLLDTWRERYQ